MRRRRETRGERLEPRALVALESLAWGLVHGPMPARIRHALEPVALLREVGVVEEHAPVHEILADVAHGALHLAVDSAPGHGRHARGGKLQCCAKRRNSRLWMGAPPCRRRSCVITAFI
jgi:hypothetical protein